MAKGFQSAGRLGWALALLLWGCSEEPAAATGACATAGAACEDGDGCTEKDVCTKGKCLGSPKVCSDGLDCTTDSCSSVSGCLFAAKPNVCVIAGACVAPGPAAANPCQLCDPTASPVSWSLAATSCDDSNVCTQKDSCAAGKCTGAAISCDDANACTADSCDPALGCQHAPVGGPCTEANPCTEADFCQAGVCTGGPKPKVCDDANPCTLNLCDAAKGCGFPTDPTACADSNPCTTDQCDKAKGCSNPAKKPGDACTNGNPCVTDEACNLDLACKGGKPLNCDDGNPCTNDSCKPGKGCSHALSTAPCDDGETCTYPDTCTGGSCIGNKTAACAVCTNAFAGTGGKLTMFSLGGAGKPGDGLNIDGDAKTCAPQNNCDGGIDNAAGVLAPFLNKALVAGVQDGTMTFVVDLQGYVKEGQPFVLNMYYAELAPQSKAAKCNGQTDVCEWLVGQTAMTPQCAPKFSFKDAVIKGGVLTAGGKDTLFAMDADLVGAAPGSTFYVKGARIEASTVFAADGKTLTGLQGVLGGAVPAQAVYDIVNATDESTFAAVGLNKKDALDLVKQLLELDIDIDGDGDKDSASIGIRFTGLGAKIVGMAD